MSNNPQTTIGISAVDNASKVLQRVDQKIQSTATTVDSASTKIESRTSKLKQAFSTNMMGIVGSATALSVGVTGITRSFTEFGETATDIAAKEVTLANTTLQLEKGIAGLADMQGELKQRRQELAEATAAGTITESERAQALNELSKLERDIALEERQIAIDRKDVATETKELTLLEQRLNAERAEFFLTIGPNMLATGAGAISMLKLTGVTLDATKIKAALFGTTTTVSLDAVNRATIRTGGAFRTLGMTMKTALLSNPIGIALIGITTLIGLVATNTFGLRDAFFSLGQMILQFLDKWFKPLADALRWLNDHVLAPLGKAFSTEMPKSVEVAGAALTDFENIAIKTGAGVTGLATATQGATDANLEYLKSLDKLALVQGESSETINLAAEFLREQEAELRRTTKENFFLIASVEGLGKAIEIHGLGMTNSWAEALRVLKQQAKETKTAVDDLNESTGGSLEERARAAFGDLGEVTGRSGSTISFIKHHAQGGVVNEPTAMLGLFSGRRGIMGEAGPEAIVPMRGGSSGGGRSSPMIIQLVTPDSRVIAEWLVNDMNVALTRRRRINMRITHEAIHGVG